MIIMKVVCKTDIVIDLDRNSEINKTVNAKIKKKKFKTFAILLCHIRFL